LLLSLLLYFSFEDLDRCLFLSSGELERESLKIIR